MSQNPYRRAQLITTFGVGALNSTPNGTAVICCGLDYWFDKNESNIDEKEFIIHEWRLEKQLKVSEFRLPPDYRSRPKERFVQNNQDTNISITIPTLRFPTWHFCYRCRSMTQNRPHTASSKYCQKCEDQGNRLVQVQFVSVCKKGHIDEFPWFLWAHSNVKEKIKCNENDPKLKLKDKGASSLEGLVVECQDCGAKRDLTGSLGKVKKKQTDEHKNLSDLVLDVNGSPYTCRGNEAWNNKVSENRCGEELIGSLRSASDIYYSKTKTSIYVPQDENSDIASIIELLNQNRTRDLIEFARTTGSTITPNNFRSDSFKGSYAKYTDEQIQKALNIYFNHNSSDDSENELSEEEFRRPE